MKRVFGDALRWQLQRIEEDQSGSIAPAGDHATINSIYAEAWAFLGRNGVQAKWTLEEHGRLIEGGWNPARAKAVADLLFDFQNDDPVSKAQLDTYTEAFGITATQDNVTRMARTICSARAAACSEATARLSAGQGDMARWINDALTDSAPFAFEQVERAQAAPAPRIAEPVEQLEDGDPLPERTPSSSPSARPRKRLIEAGEDCIAAYVKQGAWETDSAKQVRTALRLFDHAAGGDAFIEDLLPRHVRAFTDLCRALPNRWGRTTAEQAGGIAASLERAATMAPTDIGISQVTINKHLTWVTAVLAHAAGAEDDNQGHRPAKPLSFTTARAGLGKTNRKERKRDRDKRANWSKQERATSSTARR